MPEPNILALDPATACGWARRVDGERASGVWRLKERDGERWVARVLKFGRLLAEEMERGRYQVVVVERAVAAHSSAAAEDLAGAWRTMVEIGCYHAGLQAPLWVYTSQLKAWAAGNGRADKADMGEAALRLGWQPSADADDNEADAWCILRYAEEFLRPTPAPPPKRSARRTRRS